MKIKPIYILLITTVLTISFIVSHKWMLLGDADAARDRSTMQGQMELLPPEPEYIPDPAGDGSMGGYIVNLGADIDDVEVIRNPDYHNTIEHKALLRLKELTESKEYKLFEYFAIIFIGIFAFIAFLLELTKRAKKRARDNYFL